ncbi:MAG: hypothetical protein CMO55_12490 [Verrucomicrobiales bacterium]|nr:hypothetical protein [Verrucomicrobiales bacterium]
MKTKRLLLRNVLATCCLLAPFGFNGIGHSLDVVVTSELDNGNGNTLRDAIGDIVTTGDPTNRITFHQDLDGQSIILGSKILINSSISIEISAASLPNGLIISSPGSAAFQAEGSTSLTLEGMDIQDAVGESGFAGGAIIFRSSGDLVVRDCDFQFNRAQDGAVGANGGNGGVIGVETGNVTLDGCYFGVNRAGHGGNGSSPMNAGNGGHGGVLFSTTSGDITITDCDFSSNNAGNGGEAFGSEDAGDGGWGGVLYVVYTTGMIDISGTVFGTSNRAGNGGDAGSGAPGDGGNAGAMFLDHASGMRQLATITDCRIEGNSTGRAGVNVGAAFGFNGDGGGIYAEGPLLLIKDSLIQTNSCDAGNNAGSAGGGIYARNGASDADITLVNTTLFRNDAEDSGGGIHAPAGADLTIIHSTIVENEATTGLGGGIYGDMNLTLENSIVYDNTDFNVTNNDDIFPSSFNKVGGNFVGQETPVVDPKIGFFTLIAEGKFGFVPEGGLPVVDQAVTSGNTPAEDARGSARIFGSAADLGAVELKHQPDNKIGLKGNPATHKRDNLYNASGAGQKVKVKLNGKRFSKYWNSVQNDGDADSVLLRQTKVKKGYKLKSFRLTGGRANVTGALKRRGYVIPNIAPGNTVVFQHKVKKTTPGRSPKLKLKLIAQSTTAPVSVDTVQVKVKPGR